MFKYSILFMFLLSNLLLSDVYFDNFSIERIENIDIRKVHQGETFKFDIIGSNDIKIHNKPYNATFYNYSFKWIPNKFQEGLYNISFEILDSDNTNFIHLNIVVLNTIFNIPIDKEYSYLFTATDPDSDPVKIEIFDIPDGASFEGEEFGPKLFKWKPTKEQIGEHSFTVKATDVPKVGESKSDIKNIIINVQTLTYEEMEFDFNDDGRIDLKDYIEFTRHWLRGVELEVIDDGNDIEDNDSNNNDIDMTQIVYSTDTGSRYHAEGCSFLRFSQNEITLMEAISTGLLPCSRCNPPYIEVENGDEVPLNTDIAEIFEILMGS